MKCVFCSYFDKIVYLLYNSQLYKTQLFTKSLLRGAA